MALKYQIELDVSKMNQDVVKEYSILETKIESFIKHHPRKKMTAADYAKLSEMLQQRVEIMRRLGSK